MWIPVWGSSRVQQQREISFVLPISSVPSTPRIQRSSDQELCSSSDQHSSGISSMTLLWLRSSSESLQSDGEGSLFLVGRISMGRRVARLT